MKMVIHYFVFYCESRFEKPDSFEQVAEGVIPAGNEDPREWIFNYYNVGKGRDRVYRSMSPGDKIMLHVTVDGEFVESRLEVCEDTGWSTHIL
jgi:hypothetical protein